MDVFEIKAMSIYRDLRGKLGEDNGGRINF
jgi:hypothetical protein